MTDIGSGMSYAVVARRHESKNSLDDFPTPPWATRALMETILSDKSIGYDIYRSTVWEPACGRGYMAKPLAQYFKSVIATDIEDYGWRGQDGVVDFLSDDFTPAECDWIITNPPYKGAQGFIERGIKMRKNVAVLVRTAFVEGVGRYNKLFRDTPPDIIAQFSERVPMVKGRLDKNASTATAYCWLIWSGVRVGRGSKFIWIPPCRKALELPTDYQP